MQDSSLRVAEAIFEELVVLPAEQRSSALAFRCAGDTRLHMLVEQLLTNDADGMGNFMRRQVITADRFGRAAVPGRIGNYAIIRELGRGGSGIVYEARQDNPPRPVALKIIGAAFVTPEMLRRFALESEILGRLQHPAIAQVYEAGTIEVAGPFGISNTAPFFAMELVRGEPVTHYCDRAGLSLRERLEIFREICNAVQHAHQKGVIHRDLKPSNVLVTAADGRATPKVIDFGIARATASGPTEPAQLTAQLQVIGTPVYMSPEQAGLTGDIDTRADVYALGVMLYELLTGRTPIDSSRLRGVSFSEFQRLIVLEEPHRPSARVAGANGSGDKAAQPAPPDSSAHTSALSSAAIAQRRRSDPAQLARALRGDLDWIVMKCLAKERRERYATVSALADDIGRYLEQQPVSASPPSAVYKLGKFARRNRGAVIAGVVVTVALLVATGVSIAFGVGEARQRRAADAALSRAQKAETEAEARADELEQVAAFQEAQLAGINATTMGVQLRQGLLEKARAMGERAKLPPDEVNARVADLEQLITGTDFTGMALESLHENFFQPALTAIETEFGDQPLVEARLLHTLGKTLREIGLLEAARSPQERALEIRRSELGDDHIDTLTSIDAMGELLRVQGNYAEAESYFSESLETARRVLGDEHAHTITYINNMGALLQAQGRYVEAEAYCREALELYRKTLGDEHLHTLRSMNNVAMLLNAQGKLEEAEQTLRVSLETRRRVLGDEHPDTLLATHNLAGIVSALGRRDEAELLHRDALEKYRRVLGDEHPDTLLAIGDMGMFLYNAGKLREAEPLTREALETRRRVLGNEHPQTLTAINNLAALLRAQGRLDEAEPYYYEALETSRRILGERHPQTVRYINNMAFLLYGQGRIAEAEQYQRQALELNRSVLGEDHTDTIGSLNNVGFLLQAQGKLEEAEPFFREALDGFRRVRGDEHPSTLTAINNMAMLLRDQGKPAEAEPYLIEALEKRRRVIGNEHPDTLTTINNMGMLLQALGRRLEAEPYCREALDTRRRVLGDEHPDTLSSIIDLGGLLRDLGRPDEAVALMVPAETAARKAYTGGNEVRLGRFLALLGRARAAEAEFELAVDNLSEAYEIISEPADATDADRIVVVTALAEAYDDWHALEPDDGHDLSAEQWRDKLATLQAATQPAAP